MPAPRVLQERWLLQAEHSAGVTKWMSAINAQICDLYVKTSDVPADDFMSQG